MHEDFSYEGDGPMGDGPRLAPIEISDLLGNSISAMVLRNMLVTGPNGIWNEFGINAERAATMLVCCELAELTAWDRDALLQAATLWGWADCPLACGGITAQSAARKIDLELKRGKHPEIFSHAEGIRFLNGLGLKVFPQLIEAVACFQEMTHNEQGEQDTSECKPSPDQAATEPAPRILKKAQMIRELERHWPTIENDLKEISRGEASGGLAISRVKHGLYDVDAAIAWAVRNGRMHSPSTAPNSIFSIAASRIHKIE